MLEFTAQDNQEQRLLEREAKRRARLRLIFIPIQDKIIAYAENKDATAPTARELCIYLAIKDYL